MLGIIKLWSGTVDPGCQQSSTAPLSLGGGSSDPCGPVPLAFFAAKQWGLALFVTSMWRISLEVAIRRATPAIAGCVHSLALCDPDERHTSLWFRGSGEHIKPKDQFGLESPTSGLRYDSHGM